MAAAFGLAAFGDRAFAADPPPPTRVLDDPSIQHGKVVFQHDGKDTIGGYLARPKAKRWMRRSRTTRISMCSWTSSKVPII